MKFEGGVILGMVFKSTRMLRLYESATNYELGGLYLSEQRFSFPTAARRLPFWLNVGSGVASSPKWFEFPIRASESNGTAVKFQLI